LAVILTAGHIIGCMSNTVLNEKRLLFCEYLSEGLSAVESYRKAGYSGTYQGASKLANSPAVKERVAELVAGRVRLASVTRAELVSKQLELAALAKSAGQFSVSSSCLAQAGKLLGMYQETIEIVGSESGDRRLQEFSILELRAMISSSNVSADPVISGL